MNHPDPFAGTAVRFAGLVTLRQRPATASGVTFVTLEDETGVVNVVVWRDLGIRQRRELIDAQLLAVDGVIQRQDGVQHVVARRARCCELLQRHPRKSGSISNLVG